MEDDLKRKVTRSLLLTISSCDECPYMREGISYPNACDHLDGPWRYANFDECPLELTQEGREMEDNREDEDGCGECGERYASQCDCCQVCGQYDGCLEGCTQRYPLNRGSESGCSNCGTMSTDTEADGLLDIDLPIEQCRKCGDWVCGHCLPWFIHRCVVADRDQLREKVKKLGEENRERVKELETKLAAYRVSAKAKVEERDQLKARVAELEKRMVN